MEKSADLRDAMHLYYDEPIWGHMNEKELSQYLIPCISLGQYHVFRYETTNVAYAFTSWAYLSDDVEKRYIKSGMLDKFDWDSGPNIWHIDTINKHNGKIKDIYKWTANYFNKKYGPTLAVNWLRLSKSGDKILRKNKMIVEKGLKKFR
jgi:hemolysin-activating ACP:hemolysin acyltransferase